MPQKWKPTVRLSLWLNSSGDCKCSMRIPQVKWNIRNIENRINIVALQNTYTQTYTQANKHIPTLGVTTVLIRQLTFHVHYQHHTEFINININSRKHFGILLPLKIFGQTWSTAYLPLISPTADFSVYSMIYFYQSKVTGFRVQ